MYPHGNMDINIKQKGAISGQAEMEEEMFHFNKSKGKRCLVIKDESPDLKVKPRI